NLLIIAQWVFGVLVEESLDLFRRAVKNDGYVVVARGPWIMKEHSGNLLIVGGTPIAQPVQCLPQSFSPLLIPGSVASAGIATAMAVPALYAVRATPCVVLDDLSFVSGRKLLQVLTVICELRQPLLFNIFKRKGESHIAVVMMMSIAFAVSGDVHQLWPIPFFVESRGQTVCQTLTTVEQAFKGYGA